MPDGTFDNPYTHELSDKQTRLYKHCKCYFCGYIARCTPNDDFFSGKVIDGKQPLACKSCMYQGKIKSSL